MAKLTSKTGNRTSFYGITINTTVNRLMEVLGEPQFQSNDGEDKVNFDWVCENGDGDVFTIYDWKEYRSIGLDEYAEFHIGSKDKLTSMKAVAELLMVI